MPIFGLDAVQANKGDALVLRWGDADAPHTALVDGGPGSVWDDHVLPHLRALAGTNPAGGQNPVGLDAVVVSHVDDDHINGIIDLADQIHHANQTATPRPAEVAEIWHNAFRDMAFLDDFADEPDLKDAIATAAVDETRLSVDPAPADPADGLAAGAQSVRQGRRLDTVLRRIGIVKNARFGGAFVKEGPPFDLHGLSVTVLAPNGALLDRLKNTWRTELGEILRSEAHTRKADLAALTQSFDDPSVPNQSSIVLLVEFGGASMLLTGDARGDQLLEAFARSPAVPALPLEVDLFKVPHHGSAHSNGPELFEAVRAQHYVISGNGEHGNPHADAVEALFASTAGRHVTVHLTNRPTAGAKKAADVAKAQAAQAVLDAHENSPDVTLVYRADGDHAVSVGLL